MDATNVKQSFSELVKAIGVNLEVLGYIRRGQMFKRVLQNNCGIIDFQRSVKDSKDLILFTINLGVVCGSLLDTVDLKDTQVTDAHLRQRIGFLMPERRDKWWEVNLTTNVQVLAQEIGNVVLHVAVPYLNKFLDADALRSLWESGQSPGLTEVQRTRLLAKLKAQAI